MSKRHEETSISGYKTKTICTNLYELRMRMIDFLLLNQSSPSACPRVKIVSCRADIISDRRSLSLQNDLVIQQKLKCYRSWYEWNESQRHSVFGLKENIVRVHVPRVNCQDHPRFALCLSRRGD